MVRIHVLQYFTLTFKVKMQGQNDFLSLFSLIKVKTEPTYIGFIFLKGTPYN